MSVMPFLDPFVERDNVAPAVAITTMAIYGPTREARSPLTMKARSATTNAMKSGGPMTQQRLADAVAQDQKVQAQHRRPYGKPGEVVAQVLIERHLRHIRDHRPANRQLGTLDDPDPRRGNREEAPRLLEAAHRQEHDRAQQNLARAAEHVEPRPGGKTQDASQSQGGVMPDENPEQQRDRDPPHAWPTPPPPAGLTGLDNLPTAAARSSSASALSSCFASAEASSMISSIRSSLLICSSFVMIGISMVGRNSRRKLCPLPRQRHRLGACLGRVRLAAALLLGNPGVMMMRFAKRGLGITPPTASAPAAPACPRSARRPKGRNRRRYTA